MKLINRILIFVFYFSIQQFCFAADCVSSRLDHLVSPSERATLISSFFKQKVFLDYPHTLEKTFLLKYTGLSRAQLRENIKNLSLEFNGCVEVIDKPKDFSLIFIFVCNTKIDVVRENIRIYFFFDNDRVIKILNAGGGGSY